jgi:hypothetical protein
MHDLAEHSLFGSHFKQISRSLHIFIKSHCIINVRKYIQFNFTIQTLLKPELHIGTIGSKIHQIKNHKVYWKDHAACY